MNYFAHALEFLDDPYFVAGLAVPDWLSVVDRKVRVRRKLAAPLASSADPRRASIARGVIQHIDDDAWFHTTPAFGDLNLKFTVMVRDALADNEGFRPSFLGHILVELLLDAELIAARPERLERYYDALRALDPDTVAESVTAMATGDAGGLAVLIPRFIEERFLWDYLDDAKLWVRLNQVMRRVKLPLLPESFCEVLPDARRLVAERSTELLTPTPPDETASREAEC